MSDDPLIGRDLDGRFTLRHRLGGGGMGTVYLAEQRSMEREVAVKVINPALAAEPQAAARFLREARLAGRVNHPGVVTVYDFGRSSEGLYLVMERVVGRTLADLLAEGPLPVERALGIARQIAEALQAAHTLDIVHRDLKPGNVMLVNTSDGRDAVKVLDFGLARSLAGDDETVTRSGTMLGTPSYLPPEVARGQGSDARGDLYALGVILYEALAGHPPFSGTAISVVMQHAYQPPPPLPTHIPPVVVRLVERLMEKEPGDRPPSATDVLARLEAALEAVRVPMLAATAPVDSLESPVIPAPSDRPMARPRWRAGWAAGGLVLGLGAFGWWRMGGADPDPAATVADGSRPTDATVAAAPDAAAPDAAAPDATTPDAAAPDAAAASAPPEAAPRSLPKKRPRVRPPIAPATAPPTAAPATRPTLPGRFIRPDTP